MQANALRLWLIALLAVAAVVSVIANKANSPWIGWVSFVLFLCSIVLYFHWRRTARQERRARVFDREAKTDETGARSDQ
jgi:membrane protein implicated in regulation of membrane protease activity